MQEFAALLLLLLLLCPTARGEEGPVTRGGFVSALWESAGAVPYDAQTPFSDVSPRADYAPAVSWAAHQGLVLGTGEGRFQPEPIEVPAVEEEPAPEPEDLLPQVVSPLDGTTVTVFSTTELMYDETMADWRTHNGLDIQAAEGDAVKTAASGMVVSIKSDELMGTTVVIEHAGGYTTQYSCLQAEPPVTEGQQVAAGDIIGLVGSTAAAESSMGPHLHFSVAKDGVIIDPSEYIG